MSGLRRLVVGNEWYNINGFKQYKSIIHYWKTARECLSLVQSTSVQFKIHGGVQKSRYAPHSVSLRSFPSLWISSNIGVVFGRSVSFFPLEADRPPRAPRPFSTPLPLQAIDAVTSLALFPASPLPTINWQYRNAGRRFQQSKPVSCEKDTTNVTIILVFISLCNVDFHWQSIELQVLLPSFPLAIASAVSPPVASRENVPATGRQVRDPRNDFHSHSCTINLAPSVSESTPRWNDSELGDKLLVERTACLVCAC